MWKAGAESELIRKTTIKSKKVKILQKRETMKKFFFDLAYSLGFLKRKLICVREEDCRVWPDYLDERISGNCEECKHPIYYEKKNSHFKKICSDCYSPICKIMREIAHAHDDAYNDANGQYWPTNR